MKGSVVALFIAPEKGLPMETVTQASASKRGGLDGDRYGRGRGSWSTPGKTSRQISLITWEAIEDANKKLPQPVPAVETRRNIITAGVELNALVGMEFWVGTAILRGTKLCDPCQRPANLAGKKIDFEGAFRNHGGLCAEVIADGVIGVGSTILTFEH